MVLEGKISWVTSLHFNEWHMLHYFLVILNKYFRTTEIVDMKGICFCLPIHVSSIQKLVLEHGVHKR
jgi:hypothetical protein